MSQPTDFDIKAGLQRLERMSRILQLALLTLSLALVVVVTTSARKPQASIIEAQGFHVIDETGETVASLGVSEQGPALEFVTGEAKRLALVVTKHGHTRMTIHDREGTPKAELRVLSNGDAEIVFAADALRPRIRVGIHGTTTGLTLFGSTGKPVFEALTEASETRLIVRDESGRELAALP